MGLAPGLPGTRPRNPGRTLVLQFSNRVGPQNLRLAETVYTDTFGEPFSVTKCRYYISGITLTDPDGKVFFRTDHCYLVDEAEATSKTVALSIPAGVIGSVSFFLGLDSTHTEPGTGDLDPLKGMYWAWNHSYVFARLEGRSDSSHAPTHLLTWDIGGNAALRTITLRSGPSDTLHITADLLTWFGAIHIARSPVCHQPGPLATELADNYSRMFSVTP